MTGYNKARIENILLATNIPGIKDLLEYMEDSGFFLAPCSIKHHLNEEGGLAEHSLSVYQLLSKLALLYNLPLTNNEIAVVALLHDMCKVEDYTLGENGAWKYANDHKASTHGSRSVAIIEKFIQMSPKERMMIEWHMGPYTMYYEGGMTFCDVSFKAEKPQLGAIPNGMHLDNREYNFFKWSPKDDDIVEKKLALVLYFCDHFSTMFMEDEE